MAGAAARQGDAAFHRAPVGETVFAWSRDPAGEPSAPLVSMKRLR